MSTSLHKGQVIQGSATEKIRRHGNSFIITRADFPIFVRKDGTGDFVPYKVGEGEKNVTFDLLELEGTIPGNQDYELRIFQTGEPVNIPPITRKTICVTSPILVPGQVVSLGPPPVFNQPVCLPGRLTNPNTPIAWRRKTIQITNLDNALSVGIGCIGARNINAVNAADRYQWFQFSLNAIATIAPGATSAVLEITEDVYLLNNSVAVPAVSCQIAVTETLEIE